MKKVLLIVLIFSLIVWLSIKVDFAGFLFNKVNSITESGDSFTRFINKKHYLIKSIAIDSTKMKSASMIELEKILNYQGSAGQAIHKILK
ncbi:MAG: hypothetical protein ACYDA4_16405 [Ignavibacteriaceae bacterium]